MFERLKKQPKTDMNLAKFTVFNAVEASPIVSAELPSPRPFDYKEYALLLAKEGAQVIDACYGKTHSFGSGDVDPDQLLDEYSEQVLMRAGYTDSRIRRNFYVQALDEIDAAGGFTEYCQAREALGVERATEPSQAATPPSAWPPPTA